MPYVDVDKLIAYFQGEWDWHDCRCVRQFAEDGEFEPVIRAKWTRDITGQLFCSKCKNYGVSNRITKRCPECGAHMDGV